MIGKNFSCNNLGQRRRADFYETPYSLTRLFLSVEKLHGSILEPAAGSGAIVTVLKEFGYDCTSYDHETDFLKETRQFDWIITNPPYSLAFEFILHAKRVCNRFAFLLPLAYLHGKQRHDQIYRDGSYGLERVYIFTRYPMLGDALRPDGKHRTGMMVYAWFVFDRACRELPRIDWLDNQPFVLSSSDRASEGVEQSHA